LNDALMFHDVADFSFAEICEAAAFLARGSVTVSVVCACCRSNEPSTERPIRNGRTAKFGIAWKTYIADELVATECS